MLNKSYISDLKNNRLKNYHSATAVCSRLESRVLGHITDDESVRQEFYKSYADLYFNKGLDILSNVDKRAVLI